MGQGHAMGQEGHRGGGGMMWERGEGVGWGDPMGRGGAPMGGVPLGGLLGGVRGGVGVPGGGGGLECWEVMDGGGSGGPEGSGSLWGVKKWDVGVLKGLGLFGVSISGVWGS